MDKFKEDVKKMADALFQKNHSMIIKTNLISGLLMQFHRIQELMFRVKEFMSIQH